MKKYILSAHAEKVISERNIKEEWIEMSINMPDKQEIDLKDIALQHNLKIIEENDNRILRVIYNKTVEPFVIITAFFDRRMKGKLK